MHAVNDQEKTKEELIAELAALRRQVTKETGSQQSATEAALIQVAPIGIHHCDTEGRITFVNQFQEAITGFTAKELVGTYVVDRMAPGPERDFFSSYLKYLASEQPTPTPYFAKNIRKNGEFFEARVDWNYIRNSQGEVTGFVSVVSDVTEQRRIEALQHEHRVLRKMLAAQDRERKLVAYEIHDDLAQKLVGAVMQFEAFEQLRDGDPRQASDCFSAGFHLLRKSLSETRRLIAGLRPLVLDESGVLAAIGQLIRDVENQGDLEVEFHSDVKFKRLQPLVENAIFRIVQESLTNIQHHSQSGTALVKIAQDGDRVRITIQDRGIGFDLSRVKEKCFGLEGIRERARVLGGWATIDSAPGQGSRIVVDLPVVISDVETP